MWGNLSTNNFHKFYNIYGPTECTVDATFCQIQANSLRPIIGQPLSNYKTYILNDKCQLVPVGVAGELYIGGPGLARGYLNRPELTAEKFLPNNFSFVGTERLYKTGDYVRLLPNGNIEFLGRIDNQIKLRGYRIELEEIEAILKQHPYVNEAAVNLLDNLGGKNLVAYIVPKKVNQNDTQVTYTDLYDFLKQKLPNFMLPSNFVLLEKFPLTSNGKLDRSALPLP